MSFTKVINSMYVVYIYSIAVFLKKLNCYFSKCLNTITKIISQSQVCPFTLIIKKDLQQLCRDDQPSCHAGSIKTSNNSMLFCQCCAEFRAESVFNHAGSLTASQYGTISHVKVIDESAWPRVKTNCTINTSSCQPVSVCNAFSVVSCYLSNVKTRIIQFLEISLLGMIV